MTDIDLDKLKHAPVPTPRAEARARALAAAAQAFERGVAASLDASPRPAVEPSSKNSTQGLADNSRPIGAVKQGPRRTWMRRETYALAASLAVLAIGLPAAVNYVRPHAPQLVTTTEAVPKRPAGQMTVAALPNEIVEKPKAPAGASDPATRRVQTVVIAPEIAPGAKTPAAPAPATPVAGMIVDAAKPGDAAKSKATQPVAHSASQSPAEQKATSTAKAGKDRKARDSGQNSGSADKLAQLLEQPPVRSSLGVHGGAQLATLPRAAPVAEKYRGAQGRDPAFITQLEKQFGYDSADERRRRQQLALAHEPALQSAPEPSRDRFPAVEINPVKSVAAEPVSTFSIDVDTASYSFARRALNAGRLPPREAVRVEEMINYFPYAYPAPDSAEMPFKPTITVVPSPWNPANKLVHIAIKGYDLKSAERPRANLVFLVDVSGSMAPADRLPLLKNAFRMLLDNLKPDDTVAIVTYASGSDVRLTPTKVAEKWKILAAIESLNAGGSTHGAAGITDAYKVAEASFDKAAVNRVILATDGDWNVGITDKGQLQKFIEAKRNTGIYLSIVGVGMGNHNDALMQALAQNGNGVAAYIDTLSEARKVLVDEASSTLFPIAKDVKIQIEFNPARVSEYRLIGYETRGLKREDFNNDKVDAGDIGSGHTVTAIYEVTPVGAPGVVDSLRYGKEAAKPASAPAGSAEGEFAFLKIRHKLPQQETSRLLTLPVTPSLETRSITEASAEVRFSVAVAAFGQLLRGQPYLNSFNYDDVIALANSARGDDPFGYRAEFVSLVRLAKSAQ